MAAEGRNEEDEEADCVVDWSMCSLVAVKGSYAVSSMGLRVTDQAARVRMQLARQTPVTSRLLIQSGWLLPDVRHEPPCACTVLCPLTAELSGQRLFFAVDPHACAAAFRPLANFCNVSPLNAALLAAARE